MSFLSSYWVKSGLYSFSQRIFTIVSGLLGFMLLVRILSREEFGVWALFLVLANIVEVSKLGFLKNAHIKLIHSSDDAHKPIINSTSFVLNVGLSIGAAILICAFALYLSPIFFDPRITELLIFYGISSIFLTPFYQLQFIQAAEFDFKAIFLSTIIRQGFFSFSILIFFLFDIPMPLLYLAILQFVFTILATVVSYNLSKKYIRYAKQVGLHWIKQFVDYGKFTAGTNISNIVFKSLDQLLIGSMTNAANVALYNNAIRISNLVEIPALSLAEIMFPKSVQSYQKGGTSEIKEMYEKSVAAILCFILPFTVLVIIFPEPLVLILSGRQYLDVVPIVRVTMLYSLIVPFTLQFGTVMDSIGHPKINFILITITAILAGVLIYIAIPIFGSIGAAYGMILAYLFNMVIGQFFLNKYVGVNVFNVLKNIPQLYQMGFGIIKNFRSNGSIKK